MWHLKFKVRNEDTSYALLSKDFDIVDYMYPVDFYIKEGHIYILSLHVLEGSENEKKKFSQALKKHKKTVEFEQEEKQIITLIKEEEDFYKSLFSQEVLHPAPVIIKNGEEIWDIFAFKRKILESIMGEIEKPKWKKKFPEFKVYHLKKANKWDIYFPRVIPKIPEKQRMAFKLAMTKGYYTFPRKIDLQGLAKESGVSTSTFQEHLRKAEAKLLPLFAESSRI